MRALSSVVTALLATAVALGSSLLMRAGASAQELGDAAAPTDAGVSLSDVAPARGWEWQPISAEVLPAFERPRAQALYDHRCRLCHGRDGRGDGAAARFQAVAPRDFTTGVFKFRSTPSGQAPLVRDLWRSITRGLPGTGMPTWSGLSEADRWQLALLVRSFAEGASMAAPDSEVVALNAPAPTAESTTRGRAVFARLGCQHCHAVGQAGATAMVIATGAGAVRATDLARSRTYRGGATSADIYRTIITGLDGSPMPSYAGTMTMAEASDLVAYVRSLSLDAPVGAP